MLLTSKKTVKKEVTVFSKKQLLDSKCYNGKNDALHVVLEDDMMYNLEEVETLLNEFMGGVK